MVRSDEARGAETQAKSRASGSALRASLARRGAVFTALTGFADWLTLEWGSEIWKTATIHMFAMVSATIFFALAAIFGHASYMHGDVSAGAFVLTLIGFGLLTLGGWLGGSIVFVHGMRVLSLVHVPASRAAAPVPHPEKERAEDS